MVQPRGTKGSVGGKSGSATSDLARRIASARSERAETSNGGARGGGGSKWAHNRAVRLGGEFISAILVGALIGYVLDLWLKTSPWLMLVMLLVGFAAGILNVVRAVAQMNAENPAPLDADLGPGDDEDDY